MKLSEYLSGSNALTISQLRRSIGAKSDAQIRQWQHGYSGRIPSPIYCAAIERATNGQVTRRDLRPQDWHLIWPELAESQASNGAVSRYDLRPDSFGTQQSMEEAKHA